VPGADHAPRAEVVGQLEGRPARRPREPLRRRADVAVDDEVEVVDRPAQEAVAQRAADEPGALAGQRLARDGQGIGRGQACSPSRW
jgi:hypothetical protein